MIGSQTPWIEVLLLESGAAHVTSLDYVDIKSGHAKITTIGLKELRSKYLDGTLPKFDVMVSISSLEHSGLGRYSTKDSLII